MITSPTLHLVCSWSPSQKKNGQITAIKRVEVIVYRIQTICAGVGWGWNTEVHPWGLAKPCVTHPRGPMANPLPTPGGQVHHLHHPPHPHQPKHDWHPANLPDPRLPPKPPMGPGPPLPWPLPLLLGFGDLGEAATRFLQLSQRVGGGERRHGGVLHEGVRGLHPAGVAAAPPGVVAARGPLGEVGAVGLLCALCAWGGEEAGLEKLENMTLIAAPILLAPSQKSVIT